MLDSEDVATVLSCLGCVGVILLKLALIVGVVWIVLHFAFKYW